MATREQHLKHRYGINLVDYNQMLCEKGLLGANKKLKHVTAYDGASMLITYYENLEAFGFAAKAVAKMAEKMDAFDIENYCGEIIEDCFTASWMVKATLRCG